MRSLACLLLLTACANEELSTRTSLVQNPNPDKERMLCDPNVCFIYRCLDSDGDGICDKDEHALETDPANRFDRPEFRDLLKKLGGRELPSFQEGQSMLVVLPTVGPDGQAVFGGDAMLPARHDLLKQIGIELPETTPNLTDGLMLVRSLESANVVEYRRPPWTEIEPPKADTTRDDGSAESTMGAALEGIYVKDFKFESMSSNNGYRFSSFTFTDEYQRQWSGTSQTGPTSSTTKVELHEKNELDLYELDKVISVNTSISESGNKITTKTVTTHYVNAEGKTSDKTTKTTTYKSSDGKEEAEEVDGVLVRWWIEGFERQTPTKENTGDFPTPSPDDPAYAYSDPDYVEYTASPEVLETVVLMRGGPVHVVDPLSDEGAETFIPGIDTNGFGPIALYAPDAASTSITDPLLIHMPFGGDYDPNAEEAPAADKTTQNGVCIYCSQGGN